MVANIRPRRLLRKIRKDQRDSEDYGLAAITRKQKPIVLAPKIQRLTHCMSSTRGSTRATTRRAHNSNNHGHLYTSIFGLGWILADLCARAKGCSMAVSAQRLTTARRPKLGSAIQAGMGPHASRPPRSASPPLPPWAQPAPTCTRGYLVPGKLAEEIRKTWRPSERTAQETKGKSLNPPNEYDPCCAG
jgi:hypothetical protein